MHGQYRLHLDRNLIGSLHDAVLLEYLSRLLQSALLRGHLMRIGRGMGDSLRQYRIAQLEA